MYAVVDTTNGTVVYGPSGWLPGAFLVVLGGFGLAPQLPESDPQQAMIFESVSILPCVLTYDELGLGQYHDSDPITTITANSVTQRFPALTYTAQQLADNAAAAAAATLAANKISAIASLQKSDVTLLRCLENGIPIPDTWVQYRKALRALIGGASSILPTTPTYPVGT